MIIVLGFFALIQFLINRELNIDRLLAFGTNASGDYGARSFLSAILFLLFGVAFLSLDHQTQRGPQPGQLMGVIAFHIAIFALIGHIFRNPALYRLGPTDAGIAIHGAVAALMVSLGILAARSNLGLSRILLTSGAGGVVVRRLLFVPLAVPFVLGGLIWIIARYEIFSRAVGGWLWTIGIFLTIELLIWWVASIVQQSDERRVAAQEAVRLLNAELEKRVEDRTIQLEETNRELIQKNQENELFVYSVSHDLRSPLVNLQGFSKELEQSYGDLRKLLDRGEIPDDVRTQAMTIMERDITESIHFIVNGVTRLSNIIDALLRLSRAGRVEYDWQEVDLNNTVRRVVESMQKSLQEKRAEVVIGELPTIWGDANALEQLFANLIGNAINYMDDSRPGRIDIGFENGPGAPGNARRYYVKDNGLGIPELQKDKIFQAFQRAHPTVAKGEGIGLTIVRRVVDRHRGRVWCESQVGQGSTFFTEFPVNPNSK